MVACAPRTGGAAVAFAGRNLAVAVSLSPPMALVFRLQPGHAAAPIAWSAGQRRLESCGHWFLKSGLPLEWPLELGFC